MSDRKLSREKARKSGKVVQFMRRKPSGVGAGGGSGETPQISAGIKGTVAKILHDGSNGQPFRALIEMKPGMIDIIARPMLGKSINKTAIVTSKRPLNAQPGDDIYATGIFIDSGDLAIPHEIIIPEDAPVHNRMRGILEQGGEVKTFGKALPGQSPMLRPAEIALFSAKSKKTVATISKDQYGAIILQTPTGSCDPALDWAAKLFKDVPVVGHVSIIDPMAFLPEPHKPRGRFGKWRAEKKRITSNAKKLSQHLPYSSPEAIAAAIGKYVAVSPGLALPMLFGNPMGDERLARDGYVVPFSPFFSSTALWAGLSNLSGNAFSPKATIDPELQKKFIVAHELAHTVQQSYGIPLGRSLPDINRGEKFADSFACLAVAQATGDIKTLRLMANIRHNHLFLGGLTHWTGPAFEDAVNLAEKLLSDGSLQKMTAQQMLKTAHNIARTHELTADEMVEIIQKRADVYEAAGIKTAQPGRIKRWLLEKGGYDTRLGHVIDPSGGHDSVKLMRKAVTDSASGLGAYRHHFARSVAALDATAWDLDALKDPDIRKQAMEIYAQDLEASAKLVNHDPNVMQTLFRIEQKMNNEKPEGRIRRLFQAKKKGFMVEGGMGADRLAFLEEKSELFIGRIGRKRHEHALKQQQRAGEEICHQPVTTIRRNAPLSVLNKVMAMDPQTRLDNLAGTIASELNALKTWRQNPQQAQSLVTATRLAQQKHDLAFALRVDGAAWKMIREKYGEEVAHDLSLLARGRVEAYQPHMVVPGQQKLTASLQKLVSAGAVKIAVLDEQGQPKKNISREEAIKAGLKGLQTEPEDYLPVGMVTETRRKEILEAQKAKAIEDAKRKAAEEQAKKDAEQDKKDDPPNTPPPAPKSPPPKP